MKAESIDVKKLSSLLRNGQRIYGGPPEGWTGPPPTRGCEVYVTRYRTRSPLLETNLLILLIIQIKEKYQ